MDKERNSRRLAAILAADMVDFSRLMERDESGTLDALKVLRTDLIDPEIAGHNGRTVVAVGDGILTDVEAQIPSPMFGILAVAEKAVLREDGAHIAVVVRRLGHGSGAKCGTE